VQISFRPGDDKDFLGAAKVGGGLENGLPIKFTGVKAFHHAEETGLPVHVAEDPLSAVAEGTGKSLNEIEFLRAVASSSDRPRV
jgi:hypothetical protein